MNFYDWFFLEKGRTPEGLFSFAHLFSVTISLAVVIFFAIFLGKKFRDDKKKQNIMMIILAIAILVTQISKIAWLFYESDDTFWNCIIGNAPLYLCDMQIFIIPLAAITRGRFRNICLDFIAIWGLLMGFLGTYFAGNIYGAHAVISFAALNSLVFHLISAFSSAFIFASGLNTMEKKNMWYSVLILVVFMVTALVVDYVDHHNFMFFFNGDGTPFALYDLFVNHNKILYQTLIFISQGGYMIAFYFVYFGIMKRINKTKEKEINNTQLINEHESAQ